MTNKIETQIIHKAYVNPINLLFLAFISATLLGCHQDFHIDGNDQSIKNVIVFKA